MTDLSDLEEPEPTRYPYFNGKQVFPYRKRHRRSMDVDLTIERVLDEIQPIPAHDREIVLASVIVRLLQAGVLSGLGGLLARVAKLHSAAG